MKPVIFLLTLLIYTLSVSAEARTSNYEGLESCPMTEQTQVNINFNSQYSDLQQVKKVMDNKVEEIETMAKKAGIEKIVLQSMNYNIYANRDYNNNFNDPAQRIYQLNGSLSFNVEPADNAIKLMEMLNDKGYNGGLNVNKYRRCH